MPSIGQLVYNRVFGNAFAGQIADTAPSRIGSYLNKSGGSLAAGIAVKYGTATDGTEATVLAATGDQIIGITVLSFATDPNNLAGTATYAEGVSMNVMEEGEIWVGTPEESVAVTDPVYVRFQPGALGLIPGTFGNSADNGTCRVVKGARWKAPTANGTARLYFSASADQAVH